VVLGSCQPVVTLGFLILNIDFCRSLRHFWTLPPKGGHTTRLTTNYATAQMYNFVTDGDARSTTHKPSTFTSLSFTTSEKAVGNSMSFDE